MYKCNIRAINPTLVRPAPPLCLTTNRNLCRLTNVVLFPSIYVMLQKMRTANVLVSLLAAVVVQSALSQSVPKLAIDTTEEATPLWVKLMLREKPNVRAIDSAYTEYYRSHPMVKTNFTKYYKRWRHLIDRFVRPDGSISMLSADEQEVKYGRGDRRAQFTAASTGIWSPFLMETYWPGTSTQCPWQANIYGFDISRSNPNILVCGSEPGGIFKTTDRGLHWTQIGTQYSLGTEAISIHPTDPSTIYLGTNGVIRKTVDGGATWTTVYALANMWVYDIEVHATNPSIVLAATDHGFVRSTDAGATWTMILSTSACELEVHPTQPQIVYTLALNNTTKRYEFWKSNDFGASFTVRNTGWYNDSSDWGGRMAVTTADPNRVYTVLLTEKGPRILRSTDAGESWTITAVGSSDSLGMTNGQGYYDLSIVASQKNANDLIVGTTTAYKSTNGGRSFTTLGGYAGPFAIHPDIQEMKAIGGETWIATDGGMTRSTDFFTDTKNADARMKGLYGSDFWGFDGGWNDDIMVGGRYHNGNTAISERYQGKFMRMGGGEAATGYVNPIASHKTYFSDIGAYILPDTFANTFVNIPIAKWPNESYWQMWYSRMTWDPRCYNTVWIGSGNTLWRSENGGARYDSMFAVSDANAWIEHIEISRSNPSVIYCTAHNAGMTLYRSNNDGKTWRQVMLPAEIPAGELRISTIALSGTNENELWLALRGGAATRKVYRTTDAGATWDNLTTPAIADVSIADMAHQLGTDGGVYIACDGGRMFYINRQMSDWHEYSDGLPVSHFTRALKPFYRDGKLRAGSNLGIWEAPFYERSKPLAQPTVDKLVTECPRDTFFFDDLSALKHDGASWRWTFTGASYVSSTTIRNPKVVYAAPGRYTVTLTVTDGTDSSTKTIANMIDVRASQCEIDSFADRALDLSGPADNATIAPIAALKGARSFTFSAWVKLHGLQPSFSQIVSSWSSNVGFSFGFAFEGYARNTNLTFYWSNVAYQLTSPFDLDTLVWTHVAIVVTPDSVTLYRNGDPWVYKAPGNFKTFDLSTTPFELGGGLPGQGGNFNGEIEEERFYDHALTTAEIRAKMHVIAPQGEPGLVGYYQFNETSTTRLYDRVGAMHASNGGGVHVASTAPVAAGASEVRAITVPGRQVFSAPATELWLGDNATFAPYTAGVYRLNAAPDSMPSGMSKYTHSYWIVRTWGARATVGSTDTIVFRNIGTISAQDSARLDMQFRLFDRGGNEHKAAWRMLDNRALQEFSANRNALWFDFPDSSFAAGQYIIGNNGSSPLAIHAAQTPGVDALRLFPNPTSSTLSITYFPNPAERVANVAIFNILGGIVHASAHPLAGSSLDMTVDLAAAPRGLYWVRVNGVARMVVVR